MFGIRVKYLPFGYCDNCYTFSGWRWGHTAWARRAINMVSGNNHN